MSKSGFCPSRCMLNEIGINLILQAYAPRLHAIFQKSNWKKNPNLSRPGLCRVIDVYAHHFEHMPL